MVKFHFPTEFINRPELLDELGGIIQADGFQHVLLLTSPKSLAATAGRVEASLTQAGLVTSTYFFSGFPALAPSQALAATYKDAGIDLVLALGGGRVCDFAKLVATHLGVPLYAAPTVAATCAAWANVSILYDQEGAFTGSYFNQQGTVKLFADTRLLLSAPPHYLKAGIVDTFAKWFEISPYLQQGGETDLLLMSHVGKIALDILVARAPLALEEAARGEISQNAVMTIDSIIYLAGLTGSIRAGKLYHGLAHTFYNLSTQIGSQTPRLHGEKVAFGLVLQQVLKENPAFSLAETLDLFAQFDNLFTLTELGLTAEDVPALAQGMYDVLLAEFPQLGYAQAAAALEVGLYQTDSVIQTYLAAKVGGGRG